MKKLLCFVTLFTLGCNPAGTVNEDQPFTPSCENNNERTLLADTIPQMYYDTLGMKGFSEYPVETSRARGIRTVFTIRGAVLNVVRLTNGKIKITLMPGGSAYIADPSCSVVAASPIGERSRVAFDTLMARYPNMPIDSIPLHAVQDTLQITGVGYFRAVKTVDVSTGDVTTTYQWDIEPVLKAEFK